MKSKEEGKKSKKVRFATDYHRRSWITCGVSRRRQEGIEEGMRLCVVQRSQIDGQNNFPVVVLCLINSYMTAFSGSVK